MTDKPQDDSASLAVPAGALDPSVIVTPTTDQYTSAEGPQAVRDRATKVAIKTRDELFDAVNRLEGRIRWLYLMMVVFVVMLGVPVTQSVESTYHGCEAGNARVVKYNAVLDRLIKPERRPDFADLYQQTRHCTGIWPFQ